MAKSKKPAPTTVVNRRAHYDYQLGEKIETGMVLTGAQVRLIRDRHAQLKGTYVTIRNHELWLLGLTLGTDTAENIKLLATKKQIAATNEIKSAIGVDQPMPMTFLFMWKNNINGISMIPFLNMESTSDLVFSPVA
jgi:tmRNA-binding protein